ncbi:MAG: hypothetical protein AAB375_03735 [Patescibacteria group bacterium]
MRYRLEFVPIHPDIVRIHVDCQLIEGQSVKYTQTASKVRQECLSEKLETFLNAVLDLDGVAQGIWIYRNELRIAKAPLYPWDRVLPHIITALKMFIADDDLVEVKAVTTA